MRHCRQCRADAIGLLGEDLSNEFLMKRLDKEPVFDPEKREMYMQIVEQDRADRQAAQTQARTIAGKPLKVAVATQGGGRINQHFGHAREFHVYEVDGRSVRFLGIRRADNYCQGGFAEEDTLDDITKALADVPAVLVARIGRCPKQALSEAGIIVTSDYAFEYIEAGLLAWWKTVNTVQEDVASA